MYAIFLEGPFTYLTLKFNWYLHDIQLKGHKFKLTTLHLFMFKVCDSSLQGYSRPKKQQLIIYYE